MLNYILYLNDDADETLIDAEEIPAHQALPTSFLLPFCPDKKTLLDKSLMFLVLSYELMKTLYFY